MNDFNRWLQNELNDRGWSQGDAARKGGFSESMLSKVLNGYTPPGIKFCRGIAKAFDVPVEEVQRRAGLLPSFTELPDAAKSWGGRLTALSVEVQDLTIDAMEAALRVAEGRATSTRG